ncbi:TetR/AcrR family transcriptional regulator [Nocardiopsis dassonvillei]|uniref:Transcriptional regulator, TetR family n=1 Tax=Nocardiopsis dassonvillei (strain ATCC 23218 / DSM 43111 / CIP 107115 / JCM 7437 / KCTC 9190 / NBRC 14626 / NCTC 10488 / NRRL B-5397 / IMRU 509) TaxID=446468 RepID=D7B2L3_NOCDD|nr:TetR/AcrR family transcriptional regulator [Nocardiopsis dassonvillei]ADH66711.1 transcriptional regulator, TetR family [Nocardiopsis dassonvillei subsp. dassonvillei DSM 43111]VEI92733.1 HTH-type transcriptional repressor Bm3R1 [Nocardiopsis dassonvillei]
MEVILEAAAQVFEREGLEATTNRVAERAGYSIGTLYQYFPNKRALLHSLAERHVEETRRTLEELAEVLRRDEPSWEDTVRRLAAAVADAHGDRPRLHSLMHAHAPRVPAGVTAVEALRSYLAAELVWHLRRCGRGGTDPERTAALLVHTADAQMHGVLMGEEDAAAELVRSLLALS